MMVSGPCYGGPYRGQWRSGFSLLGLLPEEWPKNAGGAYIWDKKRQRWSWYIHWRAAS